MPYVQRDKDGNIQGVFSSQQYGLADEVLKDDDPEILSFLKSQQPRPLLAKSVIIDRLFEAGKLDVARAALDSADLYTRERWNCRDAIYADDPTAKSLLSSIGADPDAILATALT